MKVKLSTHLYKQTAQLIILTNEGKPSTHLYKQTAQLIVLTNDSKTFYTPVQTDCTTDCINK